MAGSVSLPDLIKAIRGQVGAAMRGNRAFQRGGEAMTYRDSPPYRHHHLQIPNDKCDLLEELV